MGKWETLTDGNVFQFSLIFIRYTNRYAKQSKSMCKIELFLDLARKYCSIIHEEGKLK